jgi:hypothetical protein
MFRAFSPPHEQSVGHISDRHRSIHTAAGSHEVDPEEAELLGFELSVSIRVYLWLRKPVGPMLDEGHPCTGPYLRASAHEPPAYP